MTPPAHGRGRASPAGDAQPRTAVDLSPSIDDLWLAEWAAEGMAGLERLLAAHAAFAAWLADRTGGRRGGTDVDHDRR